AVGVGRTRRATGAPAGLPVDLRDTQPVPEGVRAAEAAAVLARRAARRRDVPGVDVRLRRHRHLVGGGRRRAHLRVLGTLPARARQRRRGDGGARQLLPHRRHRAVHRGGRGLRADAAVRRARHGRPARRVRTYAARRPRRLPSWDRSAGGGQVTKIRPATTDDAVAAAEVYATGGLDEAVFSWVIPGDTARRAHVEATREFTVAWLTGAMETGEVVLALTDDDTVVGVSLWERVDSAPPREISPETAAFLEQAYGEYAPRMELVMTAVAERHPHDTPHWYLQQVVVDAAHRGQGIGGALLRE